MDHYLEFIDIQLIINIVSLILDLVNLSMALFGLFERRSRLRKIWVIVGLTTGICSLVLLASIAPISMFATWILTPPFIMASILGAAVLGLNYFETQFGEFGQVGWLVVVIIGMVFVFMTLVLMLLLIPRLEGL